MSLYPASKAYDSFHLPVSHGHKLWVELHGNKQAKQNVLFVHGGPGGGFDPDDARRPKAYNIILFDQRGSGKSTPASSLEDNDTWKLVEDIEHLRQHLKIERWIVFGGSWGSCLGIAYAQSHPEPVKALVLRGIFTLRKKELDFFYECTPGTNFIFADEFKLYESVIPEEERGNMIEAYYKRLTSDDKDVRQKAASAWSRWEMATSRLIVDPSYLARAEDDGFADRFARIECHYFVNHGFMEDGHLLKKEQIDKIRHIPAVIVQGRYDMVCPMVTAHELHEAWPEAKFNIIPDAGHSAKETGIEKALVEATDSFRDI